MKHLKMFKYFQDEVENHCNKKIKNLCLDHKGRYLSYKFSKHLRVEESFHRLVFPETPQEYGVFEKCYRTLFDMVGSKVLFYKIAIMF